MEPGLYFQYPNSRGQKACMKTSGKTKGKREFRPTFSTVTYTLGTSRLVAEDASSWQIKLK